MKSNLNDNAVQIQSGLWSRNAQTKGMEVPLDFIITAQIFDGASENQQQEIGLES